MARPLRHATAADWFAVQAAIRALRKARNLLTDAGCPRAAARVRVALKSAEGAERHVYRRELASNLASNR